MFEFKKKILELKNVFFFTTYMYFNYTVLQKFTIVIPNNIFLNYFKRVFFSIQISIKKYSLENQELLLYFAVK